MKSAKRLADAFPEIQDYQIAYVITSLKVYEGVLNLTTTSDAHFD